MARKTDEGKPGSERARARDELLEAALARPGVKEFMEVYGDWREKDRGLDTYRAATKTPGRAATAGSSGIR